MLSDNLNPKTINFNKLKFGRSIRQLVKLIGFHLLSLSWEFEPRLSNTSLTMLLSVTIGYESGSTMLSCINCMIGYQKGRKPERL